MAQSSYFGELMRMRQTAYAEDEPVSATSAFNTRNNLLHMADEFCQTRINWCAGIHAESAISVVGGFGDYWGSTPPAVYEQEFPHTWLNSRHPANLDLLIRSSIVAGGGEEMNVRVRVVPWQCPVGDMGFAAIIDETHQVTNTTGVWSHQEIFDPDDSDVMSKLSGASIAGAFEISENNEWHYPETHLLKLQIQLEPVTGSAPFYMMITGVMVREFA